MWSKSYKLLFELYLGVYFSLRILKVYIPLHEIYRN